MFITGILVALIEQYSSICLSVRWTQTAVFVVLVLYLIRACAVQGRAPSPPGSADASEQGRRGCMELWFNYFDQILIYVTLALSLNLLLGYAGQVSVAHAAFGAVGGYSMGYLAINHHWNFVARHRCSAWCSPFVVGGLVALPALKLSVEYLILLTLGRVVGDHRVLSPRSLDSAAPTASSACPTPTCSAGTLQQAPRLDDPVARGDAARLRHLPAHRRVALSGGC